MWLLILAAAIVGAGLIIHSAMPAWYAKYWYPLEYVKPINREAAVTGLDPALIAALIWRESDFDPTSRSGRGAVGLTQQLVWLGFATAASAYGMGMANAMGIANVSLPHVSALQMAALVLFFLLGYTFYASLFAAVGAMCNSQEEATQAAQPVMMLLVASIILVQPIMTTPTGRMATVMSLLPFSSPIIMPLVMSGTQVPAWQLAASIALLLVACLGAIWVSARIYRVGLLMTGKRPSLAELVRWIRHA